MSIKSLICPIEGNPRDIERAINEITEFSKYEGLDQAKSERLRLIGEELLGMVEGILSTENGRFWIEKDTDYAVNFAASAEIGDRAKAILDQTSKNTEYKGLKGLFNKTVDVFEKLFEAAGNSPDAMQLELPISGVEMIEPSSFEWSLSKYEEDLERNEKVNRWDELELPVLKKMSKDIVISYRNKRIDIKVIADI